MANAYLRDKNIIDVVKYKWLWLGISIFLTIPALLFMGYSMVQNHSPMKLGIDFTGGTLLQYGFDKNLSTSDVATVRQDLVDAGIENPVIQITQTSHSFTGAEKGALEKKAAGIKSIVSIRTRFLSNDKKNNESLKVEDALKKSYGTLVPLQVSSIGPTLGKELFVNSMIGLLVAFMGIVGYLSFRFQLDYAIFALVALLHDAIFVCGVFAALGIFFGTEIDSLFITAILTVIGFSVHDTIVVFDRIRENSRFLAKKMSFNDIVNASVNQTLARSINTSVTALITLIALYLFGGSTTKDFVLAMILGITIGTYSSIFNASVLLAMWRSKNAKPVRRAEGF